MNYYGIAVNIIDDSELNDDLLSDIVKKLSQLGATSEEIKKVRNELEINYKITHSKGEGLRSLDQEPWLDDCKAKLEWTHWEAYKSYLLKENFARETIRTIDYDTDEILNCCGNPNTDQDWKIRGLVMGDVQSGKTANYAALINKAVDAGYKMVIVLTGTIEELRSQTQERIDETFVGRESNTLLENQISSKIGVGNFKNSTILSLTSLNNDFLIKNKEILNNVPLAAITSPILLVLKKNKATLTNVKTFLKANDEQSGGIPISALILDDEADNASVNANKDDSPTTINKLIREILSLFKKSTYVAYTATPFANVFVKHDDVDAELNDIFPSNFIYSLKQPDNYVGINTLFGDKRKFTNHIEYIEDAQEIFPPSHKKEQEVTEIPLSMHEAIDVFLLTNVIRDLRQEKLKHRSMLINVTRFTDVQTKIAKIIEDLLEGRKEIIKQYLSDDINWEKGGAQVKQIHMIWEKYFINVEFNWDQIRKKLYESIHSVKVVTINQKSQEKLNYKLFTSGMGRRVIAVGGLTLSRGLTLEGLAVSYFYRDAQAADTLLQMGRWFGYRKGYEDIFKIWIDPEVERTFEKVSDTLDDLRNELRTMHFNGRKPKDFGIKIKDHPESILITARNKMRNAQTLEFTLSFSGKLVETPYLSADPKVNSSNLEKFSRFIGNLSLFERFGTYFFIKGVSKEKIAELLGFLNFPEKNIEFHKPESNLGAPLIQFIRDNEIPELQNWIISIPNGKGKSITNIKVSIKGENTSVEIKPRERQFEKKSNPNILELNRRRVGNIEDEAVGIEKNTIDSQLAKISKQKEGKFTSNDFRAIRGFPILTISLIEPIDAKIDQKIKTRKMLNKSDIKVPIVFALSLSFPTYEDSEARKVKYKFNTVALQNMGLLEDNYEQDD